MCSFTCCWVEVRDGEGDGTVECASETEKAVSFKNLLGLHEVTATSWFFGFFGTRYTLCPRKSDTLEDFSITYVNFR